MGRQQRPQPAEAGRRGFYHRGTLRRGRSAPSAPLKLDQFLKWQGLAATGGEAQQRIPHGDVRVNDAIETRRRRQLHPRDVVSLDGREVLVTVTH